MTEPVPIAADQTERDYSRAAERFFQVSVTVGFVVCAVLAVKAGADVSRYRRVFPSWFAPATAAIIAVVIAFSAWMAATLWRRKQGKLPAKGKLDVFVWAALSLSFVCTSALHGFCPFKPSCVDLWSKVSVVLRFNAVLALFSFVATISLAVIYFLWSRKIALVGAILLGFMLLVPNDDCANPFNLWWIKHVGASPLMYLPNFYAILFAVCAFLGARRALSATLAVLASVAVLMLGLGHMTRIIW